MPYLTILKAYAMNYGYIRVSTIEQNIDRQLDQLPNMDYIYTDKLSGKDTNRPQLDLLLSTIKAGDSITICSIDRLARNIEDLSRLVRIVTKEKKATIIFIKEHLIFNHDDTNSINTALLGMLGVFAQFERDMINARIKEGIAAKRDRGGYKLTHQQLTQLNTLAASGVSKINIAKQLGVSRNTIYYYLNKDI